MPSATEYRPGFSNSLLLVLAPLTIVGLILYVALTEPIPKTVNPALAIGFCAAFGALMGVMAVYGSMTFLFSRLIFDDFGVTFQDIAFPRTCIPWKEITAVSIENLSTKNSVEYGIVFRLADVGAFLDRLPRRTQVAVRKRQAYLPDGIRVTTGNLAITLNQLSEEFSQRTDVPLRYPGSQQPWSDAQVAAGPTSLPNTATQRTLVRESTQLYRMSVGRFAVSILIGVGLLAGSIWMLCLPGDARTALTVKIYELIMGLCAVAVIVSTVKTAVTVRLSLEPEGLVSRDSSGATVRFRWEDVSGVHVAEVGGNAVPVLMVELADFGAFLRSLDPSTRKKVELRRARLGDGVPIFLQTLGLSAPALARQILHRAGLPQAKPIA